MIDCSSKKVQESLANAKVSARQPCTPKTDFDMKEALCTQGHSLCYHV